MIPRSRRPAPAAESGTTLPSAPVAPHNGPVLLISRWWDAGVVAAAVLVAALAVATTEPTPWVTVTALAALAVAHVLLGRRAVRAEGTALAYGYAAIVVVCVGVACAGAPIAAMVQMVAYPVIWMVSPTVRVALGWNAAMALAVFVGTGWTGDWTDGLLTALLSCAMSVMVGLWITRMATYGAERDALIAELRATQDSVAALERQAGQDAERERVAREIHDTIAQSLTGLVMVAQRAQREAAQREAGGEAPDAARGAENLAVIAELATDALGEARALVAGYSRGGALTESLARLAEGFERETGVRVTLTDERADRALSREQEVVLLRCAQESLANVRKHARASHVLVRLTDTPAATALTVTDDGVGLGPDGAVPSSCAPGEGRGLPGMRQRLALAGGTLEIGAGDGVSPREGTRVRVSLPHAVVAPAEAPGVAAPPVEPRAEAVR